MTSWIDAASGWLWGVPMLSLVLGVGLYVGFKNRFVQVWGFVPACRAVMKSRASTGEGDVSSFAALMTAVGGVVGNGNIAGVATAIMAGGPGALFWMWVSGVVGMATMFAESVLGVRYRRRAEDGFYAGGPMYYLETRLGWPKVAGFFAFVMAVKTLVATTTVQSNSIASVVQSELGWAPIVTCSLVALVAAFVILGGVHSIGRVSEILTPLMGAIYLIAAGSAIAVYAARIPEVFGLVFEHAFTPAAGAGGFLGATVQQAMRFGLARGVYSNEAGTGSVPIAHASAQTSDPISQGKIAMLGVFIDTLVVATATGFVLLLTGAWQSGLDSAALTAHAMGQALGPLGAPTVMIASVLFGLSTLIAWAFYGETCAAYLFGPRAKVPYRLLYCIAITGGALAGVRATWALADLLNAFVVIPNLVALLLLAGEVGALLQGKSPAPATGASQEI